MFNRESFSLGVFGVSTSFCKEELPLSTRSFHTSLSTSCRHPIPQTFSKQGRQRKFGCPVTIKSKENLVEINFIFIVSGCGAKKGNRREPIEGLTGLYCGYRGCRNDGASSERRTSFLARYNLVSRGPCYRNVEKVFRTDHDLVRGVPRPSTSSRRSRGSVPVTQSGMYGVHEGGVLSLGSL